MLRDGKVDILPAVRGKDYFDIRFQGNELWITAGKYVGVVPLNDEVAIRVEPKVPVHNIVALLLGAAGEIAEVAELGRQYCEGEGAPPSVVAAIANGFLAVLRRIETAGVEKNYARNEERGGMPRGQIDFQGSIQESWAKGRCHEAVYGYWELGADGARNRTLRYACRLLLEQRRAVGLAGDTVAGLAHFEEVMARAGVMLERGLGTAGGEERTGSADYRRAERLAEVIARQRGIELPGVGGDVELPSFLVNLEAVFEAYVRRVLEGGLVNAEVRDGNGDGAKPLFDNRAMPLASPDIVILGEDGSPAVVAEVKYKARDSRDDINQILTYALTYGVHRAVLLLPADAESEGGLTEVGAVGGVEVYRYRVDLGCNALEDEEQRLTKGVQTLVDGLG